MPVATPTPTKPASAGTSARASSSTGPPRNPVRLSVVATHHGTSDNSTTSRPSLIPSSSSVRSNSGIPASRMSALEEEDEVQAVRRAAVKRVQLQKKVEKWMDRLMEETVDRSVFKRAAGHFTPPQYLEVIHERHLNSLCSYPLCSNPPRRPYSSTRRFVISTRARTIKPQEGNEDEGFCSKKCRLQSTWVEKRLSGEAIWLRTTVEDVELAEELEERADEVKLEEMVRSEREKAASPSPAPTPVVKRQPAVIANPKQPLPNEMTSPNPGTNAVTALIDSLTIHERPIVLPTLPGRIVPDPSSAPLPLPLPQPQPQSHSPSHTHSARNARREPSSILSTTSALSRTLVSATNSVPKPVTISAGPGQDDEGVEDKDGESDWEKEMSFGAETEEEKAWFEEAFEARRMVQDEE